MSACSFQSVRPVGLRSHLAKFHPERNSSKTVASPQKQQKILPAKKQTVPAKKDSSPQLKLKITNVTSLPVANKTLLPKPTTSIKIGKDAVEVQPDLELKTRNLMIPVQLKPVNNISLGTTSITTVPAINTFPAISGPLSLSLIPPAPVIQTVKTDTPIITEVPEVKPNLEELVKYVTNLSGTESTTPQLWSDITKQASVVQKVSTVAVPSQLVPQSGISFSAPTTILSLVGPNTSTAQPTVSSTISESMPRGRKGLAPKKTTNNQKAENEVQANQSSSPPASPNGNEIVTNGVSPNGSNDTPESPNVTSSVIDQLPGSNASEESDEDGGTIQMRRPPYSSLRTSETSRRKSFIPRKSPVSIQFSDADSFTDPVNNIVPETGEMVGVEEYEYTMDANDVETDNENEEGSSMSEAGLDTDLAREIAKTDLHEVLDIMVRQSRLFRCDYCDMYFPSYSTYILHRGCHGNQDPFQCHFCQVSFNEKFGFLTHFMQCVQK